MPSRVLSLIAVPAAAAAALATLSAPAHAESASVDDVAGDVTEVGGGEVPRDLQGASSADVRRLTLAHGASRIKVSIRVRDLDGGRGITPNAAGYLRTPDGDTYRVNRTASAGGGQFSELVRLRGDRAPVPVDCGVTGRRSPKNDLFTFAFDRSCIDDPTWLRFGGAAANLNKEVGAFLVDDARREGGYQGGDDVRIGGPRVYAGTPR